MKRLFLCLSCLSMFLVSVLAADALEVKVVIQKADKTLETRMLPLKEEGNVQKLVIPKDSVPKGLLTLEVHHPYATAKAGEDGFYVFCSGMYGTFRKLAKNAEYKNNYVVMPIWGVKTPRGAMTAIMTGMRYEAAHHAKYQGGVYTIFPRYNINGDNVYEDFGIEFHLLDKTATYSDMAKVYRKYQLDRGACRPLKERIKGNLELAYAAQAMEIRVRMAWKPVPSPVPEQTAENEPPLKAVVTFERMNQIIDEFKRQGINKAEFCLVGWNIGGHDGRYPQIFPADERLGGEARLRETIKKAQKEGFQITCHTNNSDAYRAAAIGGCWDERYLLVGKDARFRQYTTWGGGNMYETCLEPIYKRFVRDDFMKLRELGFRGVHYIDVLSTVNPRTCYSKEHPLTKQQYADWADRIFADTKKAFGGASSEGGFDYFVGNLDSALCITFYKPGGKLNPLIERYVPFWHLVYNGIVLNSPFRSSINYTIKDPLTHLKVIEFGGRPHFYYYSKFQSSGSNSMGEEDLVCGTDEELRSSVASIKKGFVEFEKLRHLQLEFLDSHDMIAKDVFKSTFSDGTSIITNYSGSDFDWKGSVVKSMSYIVAK
ncbi:MAG: DUF5696 domain-containing protein [Verrucomicrobiia bacterium]